LWECQSGLLQLELLGERFQLPPNLPDTPCGSQPKNALETRHTVLATGLSYERRAGSWEHAKS
jgi:hypothetical protein